MSIFVSEAINSEETRNFNLKIEVELLKHMLRDTRVEGIGEGLRIERFNQLREENQDLVEKGFQLLKRLKER